MFPQSEAGPYSASKHKHPIPGVSINTAIYNPIEVTTLRLTQVQNAILLKEQELARNRRGKKGARFQKQKAELVKKQVQLTQALALLTATPKKDGKLIL